MNAKLNFYACLACMLISGAVCAQAPVAVAAKDATVEGTPYLDDAFAPGEVYSGSTVSKFQMRYNIFQDIIEYKQGNQTLVFDPGSSIKKIKIGATTFVVQRFELKGKTRNGFFVLLDSGKVSLYSKKVVTFLEGKVGGNIDGTDSHPRYNKSADVFYYKLGTGELREVENVKSMIAGLPDRQDDLMAFAKKEKVSTRKEKTMIQLVEYYNSR